jgi:xanthine dehydrogenase molybdopterin-binding subunit B
VDATAAEQVPGFVTMITARDVPGINMIGAVIKDEELFATQEVLHHGTRFPLCLVGF